MLFFLSDANREDSVDNGIIKLITRREVYFLKKKKIVGGIKCAFHKMAPNEKMEKNHKMVSISNEIIVNWSGRLEKDVLHLIILG